MYLCIILHYEIYIYICVSIQEYCQFFSSCGASQNLGSITSEAHLTYHFIMYWILGQFRDFAMGRALKLWIPERQALSRGRKQLQLPVHLCWVSLLSHQETPTAGWEICSNSPVYLENHLDLLKVRQFTWYKWAWISSPQLEPFLQIGRRL